MKSIPKLIFYLIVVGVIFNAIKLYYYQANMEFILFEKTYEWYFKLAVYGNILISIASILSFVLYRKYFPAYITFCYLALILLVFLASYNDLAETATKPSFFYSSKGIGTFLNIGILFFAANTHYFSRLLKLFYYLCFVFIIAGLINLGKVGFGLDRYQYLNAIREYTVYLIWVFPYFLLQDESNKKKYILNIIIFLFIFLFVLSTGARSYLLIYIIYFGVKFKDQLQKKNAVLAIIGMAALVALGFVFLSNSGLSKIMEGAFKILSERSKDDSRSDQLSEFIAQYDFDYLLQGVGPLKKWYWSSVGQYEFLDNQFLLIGWWAGVPTVLVYIFLVVKSFFHKGEILLFENIKGLRLIIGLWILACLGLAIYVAVNTELNYYFITLLMGLHTCKFTKIYSSDIEET